MFIIVYACINEFVHSLKIELVKDTNSLHCIDHYVYVYIACTGWEGLCLFDIRQGVPPYRIWSFADKSQHHSGIKIT